MDLFISYKGIIIEFGLKNRSDYSASTLYLSQKLDLEIEIDNIAKIFNKNFQKRYPSDIIKLGYLLLMLNMFKLKFIYF